MRRDTLESRVVRACLDLLGKTPGQGALRGMTRSEFWLMLLYHGRHPELKAARHISAFLTEGKERD